MHGVSGSGKSFVAKEIAKHTASVVLRADAIRKHLTKTPLIENNSSIYSNETSNRVYDYLGNQAKLLASSGFNIVIDATYLNAGQRQETLSLFLEEGLATNIMSVRVQGIVAMERIRKRQGDVSDANEAVLRNQLANFEGISDQEQPYVIICDNTARFQFDQIIQQL